MAATPLTVLDDVVQNMIYQTEVSPSLASLVTVLNAYRVANAGTLATPLLQDDKNAMLKLLTGCVVATGTDLNCYPSGYATTVCFDLSGNPVP